MKIEVNTAQQARDLARTLRLQLKNKAGLTLGVGHSQEVLSALLGHSNWDTLNGLLKAASATPAPSFSLVGTRTFYIEAYACSEWGDSPRWAKVTVDQRLLAEIERLKALAQSSGLSEVRSWEEPEEWDGNDHIGVGETELVVLRDGSFWYKAAVRHADYTVETRGLTLDTLYSLLKEADEHGWQEIVYAAEVDQFKEMLDDCDELLFCDKCSAPYQAGGDGFDGMCPSCADAAEENCDHEDS